MSTAAHHYHYGDGRASSAEMYLHRLSGQEKEPHIVSVDHSYAKAWNAHPDSHHAKPAKLLFMKDVFLSESKTCGESVMVNVETWKDARTPPYDGSKTRNLMSECERSASLSSRPDASWDDNVKRLGWTTSQHRVFNQVMRLLHADRLARLAYSDTANEPVLRRLAVDRTARRLRRIMASWDLKLLQWLHQMLMEKASVSYVAAYLDALQALRAHLPQLIDKLVGHTSGSVLLRRPWDPVAPFLSQHKPKRLPCAPLLVVCPSGPRPQAAGLPKFWTSQLSVLGKLVTVEPTTAPNASLNQVLEAMVAAARAKVLELKSSFSSRPVVLIGWMIGGLVACQVSLLESVAAVVCFGFPLVGFGGSRDVDDPLLDSHTPTLFVVGQNALSCSMDELENFREHMKAPSGLVVVGGADDALHMCALKKRLEGVTQSMVDRCILDEVGAFLQWVLSAPLMGPAGSVASTARRCSPEVARRQSRPYQFYHPASSLNMEPGLKSSIVATKRGSGRRVGRPPKQVTEKPIFSTFAASLKVPRPLHRKRTPSLQSDPLPAPDVPLSQMSEVDFMPTSSLWSQSLIADPQSSPCSSPMSSPMSRFQHYDHSSTILPGEANISPAAEEGKFVSLADGGVRTSQLQKPLNQAASTQAACQMVLPANGTISMVVTPTKMELLSGHSASEATMQPSSALEMLAEASSTHRDTVQVNIRQKASLPSTAATRTRKVRMPRFYDS